MTIAESTAALEILQVVCPACGGFCGEPGSNFGDSGFHPCYFCGAAGVLTFTESIYPEPPEGEVRPLWYDDASYAAYQSMP